MKTSTAAALAILLSVNVAAAEAPIDDGKTLLTNCKQANSYCIGYIRAIVQLSSLHRAYYCTPFGDRDRHMTKAVVDYLEQDANAEFHYPAVMLTLNALNKAFTCPKP